MERRGSLVGCCFFLEKHKNIGDRIVVVSIGRRISGRSFEVILNIH